MLSMKNNMKHIAILVVVLLVVAGIVVWAVNSQNNSQQSDSNSQSDNVANNNYTQDGHDGTDETPAEPTGAGEAPTTPARLTYSEALKIYGTPNGNGFRYQFAANCLASPQKLSMKRGTKFMIDNRDSVAHTIAIGSQSFRLSRNGFAIVTSKDVGDFPVKCDGINRSQITVSR